MDRLEINCDMGDSFGIYTYGMDSIVLPHITSANIPCGFQAGDPKVIDQSVQMAEAHGVGVGAHPGFPDLMGFGRRTTDYSPQEIKAFILVQIRAIGAFAPFRPGEFIPISPHGFCGFHHQSSNRPNGSPPPWDIHP